TTFSNCPNNSKLTRPNSPDQAIRAPATISSGTPARMVSRIRAASGAKHSGTRGPGAVRLACSGVGRRTPEAPARYASPMILANAAAARDAGPIGRSGRWPVPRRGGVAPGRGRAVDQRVLVRMSQRPVADRAAAREPPVGVILRRARRLRLLHGRADRVVAVDDQGGQQVVPAREVAV